MRDAAWYFEPPLNDLFMRQKYLALYIFHFVDDGFRFDLRRDPSLYQRVARSGLIKKGLILIRGILEERAMEVLWLRMRTQLLWLRS